MVLDKEMTEQKQLTTSAISDELESFLRIRKGRESDEPTDEQKEWVLFRLSHRETWPDDHENKIGDSENWRQ